MITQALARLSLLVILNQGFIINSEIISPPKERVATHPHTSNIIVGISTNIVNSINTAYEPQEIKVSKPDITNIHTGKSAIKNNLTFSRFMSLSPPRLNSCE